MNEQLNRMNGLTDTQGAGSWRQSARSALIVLTSISLLNYLDRYIVASLVNELTQPPPSGLGLSGAQVGWLSSGFVIVYLLTSPLFGSLADRRSRPRLIAAGVTVWAIATAAGGLAGTFAMLFAARSVVGIGEAAYGTAAPAMLADAFPKSRRGRVFAIFYAAVPLGAALGYVLGGLIEQHYGWRPAFFIAGLPGLALAVLVWLLKDPPRGANDPNLEDGGSPVRPAGGLLGTLKTYGHLFTNRAFTLPVLGYAAYTFAIGALAFWMPDFLEKSRGLSVKEATVEFGASFAVAGLLGTLLGGWLADRLLKRTEQAYLWVCGVSMLIAVPFLFLALAAESPRVYLAAMVLGEIFVFIPTGPVNSAVINAVAPQDRAKAMAACILAIHLLGDVPSPPLVGFVSDVASLEKALLMVPIAALVCSVIWLGSAVIGGRDRGAPVAEPQRNPDKKGL